MSLQNDTEYNEQQVQELEKQEEAERASRIDSIFNYRQQRDIGQEAKAFLSSKLGRFILDSAIKMEDDAKNQLVALNRSDFETPSQFDAKFAELQNDAHIPGLIMTWINESIQNAVKEDIIINADEESSDEKQF